MAGGKWAHPQTIMILGGAGNGLGPGLGPIEHDVGPLAAPHTDAGGKGRHVGGGTTGADTHPPRGVAI